MDPPEFFSGNRPSPRKELQGPRPAALKVNKDSHKIRKPPVAPHPQNRPAAAALHQPEEDRQPVIIYAVSPKVIHTTVSDFMNLVQRLTGNASGGGASSSGAGDVSPAARMASIEMVSPPKDRADKEIGSAVNGQSNDFIDDFLVDAEVEVGRTTGILSPAPGSLPVISPGMFSPAPSDPFAIGYNMFIPSPSTLFSAPMVSPSPTSCDLLNSFFDF